MKCAIYVRPRVDLGVPPISTAWLLEKEAFIGKF